jgi:hypothetical protein
MASGDRNQLKSYEKALSVSNVDPEDWIRHEEKDGCYKLFYRTKCNACGSDRGYQPLKRAKKPNCLKCIKPGKYERTDKHRQKSSECLKLAQKARIGTHHSEETKKVLSQKQKEYCNKNGNQFAGLKHSQNTKAFLSDKNSNKPPQWKGRIFQYNGIQGSFKVRSSWELAYANWLDSNGISWEYEPKFKLSNGMTYSPDFRLKDGTIIEIKGFWTEKAKLKWSLFLSDYPDLNKKVLEQQDLSNLGVL